MLHRIIKFFSLACLTMILAISGILGWHFLALHAQTYDLGGWYWTANYGWISLNSDNPKVAGYADSPVPYKVIVENGEMYGWGWSSNVGWVCFGKTCQKPDICGSIPLGDCNFGTVTPPGGWYATIDKNAPPNKKIEGWAKILSLNDTGLIKLGMGPAASNQAGVACYDCQPICDEWNDDGGDPPVRTTCKTYSNNNFESCNACFTRTRFNSVKYPSPDDGTENYAVGGNGNICFSCAGNCQKLFLNNPDSPIKCDSCSSCFLYGGANVIATGGTVGWAWNGNDDGAGGYGKDGAGWIHLNPTFGDSGLIYPWVQTVYGSIYGQSTIKQRAIVAGVNATYCIFSQGVYNFKSNLCVNNQNDLSSVKLSFPAKSGDESYKNALGRLDLIGLSKTVKTSGGHNYNKYGNIIEAYTPISSRVLNNKVLTYNEDLFINNELTISNGGVGEKGNGLIIVDGDLYIRKNIIYDSGSVDDLSKLASVAWVVKGDIIVDPSVTTTSGAFIALGKDNVGCQFSDDTPCDHPVDYPKFKKNGYGVFVSGNSAKPLVISGLLIAKAFNFERTYSNLTQGSEKIIYDGRLTANPPPGLKNMLEILPVIRDFEYQ